MTMNKSGASPRARPDLAPIPPIASWCLLLAALLPATDGVADEYRISHCLMGCPQGVAASNHLIVRPIYTLSYNSSHKAADWVAYRVSSDTVGIASSLSRDPLDESSGVATLSAQDFAGVDSLKMVRARYVPLVSFAGTPYWNEVNYLSNAVARSASLSQGAWYGLDWAVRNLVNREGELFVLTGPIYRQDGEVLTLPTDTPHRVPDGFFKLIANGSGEFAAFRFDQDTSVGVHHCERRATLAQLQEETGLNFFPQRAGEPEATLYPALGCPDNPG